MRQICDASASYNRGLSGALCPLWSVVPVCRRFEMWWRLRQFDPVGEFTKPMAPGPRSSILRRREFDG
jgi:hypothetical protein